MADTMERITVYAHSLDTVVKDAERAYLLLGDVADWVKESITRTDDLDQEGLYRAVRVLELLEENLCRSGNFLADIVTIARGEAAPSLGVAQGVAE